MKTVISTLMFMTFAVNGYSQNFIQFYADLADSCRLDSITSYLQQFEALGVKEYNTTELQDARDWLINKYTDWGYTDIVQDDFNVFGNNTLTNLIITKTGTVYPNTYVIIDGHYDTKTGTGTNDNGTGTSIILELARILKDVPTEYSIKFIHFSGEEIGLTGSDHYVSNVVVPNNMDIKVVFNIDEVGGVSGMTNNTIVCERDEAQPNANDAQSAIMTDQLATCIGLYSNLQTEISFAYASDYIPFMNAGYVVTGLYEKNESPHAHTSQDLLINMDIPYVYQITKGSMGALAHYAIAYQNPVDTSAIDETGIANFNLYPNPALNQVTIEAFDSEPVTIEFYALTGAHVLETEIEVFNSETIDLSTLDAGIYLVKGTSQGRSFTRQLVKN